MSLFVLLAIGAFGGFVAGLVGIGGGVVFGPALFVVYQAAGVQDPVLTPLTVGSSLLCTFAAAVTGAVGQYRAGTIDLPTAGTAGTVAAGAVVLVGFFVTTQPWYDGRAFQLLLGAVLVLVAARMVASRSADDNALASTAARPGAGRIGGIGAVAGALAALAGIGGGVVLVPLFHSVAHLPLKVAAGTSTGAIVLIAGTGVVTYAVLGLGADVPAGAVGYVGWRAALTIALPAMLTARLGVAAAHRLDGRVVRYAFAALSAVVAVDLLAGVLS